MRLMHTQGFTLPELLLCLLFGTLVLSQLDQSLTDRGRQRELATQGNLKTIQTALERYHTDFEQYPRWLLGGDPAGWTAFHTQFDESPVVDAVPGDGHPEVRFLRDPLIQYGYFPEYPSNPFVDDGNTVLTASSHDPRFGSDGAHLGNVLDDPSLVRQYEFWQNGNLNIDLLDLQAGVPKEQRAPVIQGGRRIVVQTSEGPVFGHIATHWPGQFFYRGMAEFISLRKGYTIWTPGQYLSGDANRFFLGVFGSYYTDGQDVIRLESTDPTGQQMYYRLPPPWSAWSSQNRGYDWPVGYRDSAPINDPGGGLPELSGGGSAWQGPWFPYDRSVVYPNAWLYGAPDGVPDGVIGTAFSEENPYGYY